jgi:hypothetical protein
MDHLPEQTKFVVDGLAIAGWITALSGVITGVFGALAAVASFAWAVIRLYETKTAQRILRKRRTRKDDE